MSSRDSGRPPAGASSGAPSATLPIVPRGPSPGGERKQLVLDVLFASDAEVLLLDEPDNFLGVPAKLALERRVRASKKTIVMISHDREVLAGAVETIVTLEGEPQPAAAR
jgi:ATPase subunit of ABC transporter with duplicated ATPase domains